MGRLKPVVQGSPKTILARLKYESTGDPVDFTSFVEVNFCITSGGVTVNKKLLNTNGNTTQGVGQITNIPDTSDIEVGDPLNCPGFTSGLEVLTVDSATQITATYDGVNPAACSATAVGVDIVVGDVVIVGNPVLGKAQFTLQPDDTANLPDGDAQIEVKVIITSNPTYIQFRETLGILSKYC